MVYINVQYTCDIQDFWIIFSFLLQTSVLAFSLTYFPCFVHFIGSSWLLKELALGEHYRKGTVQREFKWVKFASIDFPFLCLRALMSFIKV
jgi:hypothetical protein